jgi:hypothetical protein
MADYLVKLVPYELNFSTESGLDTSIINGVSKQRTVNVIETVTPSGRALHMNQVDGSTFTDAVQTIADVTGIVLD